MSNSLSAEDHNWFNEEAKIIPRIGVIAINSKAWGLFALIMVGLALGSSVYGISPGALFFACIGAIGHHQLGSRAKHMKACLSRIEDVLESDAVRLHIKSQDYSLVKNKDVVSGTWMLKSVASLSCWAFWVASPPLGSQILEGLHREDNIPQDNIWYKFSKYALLLTIYALALMAGKWVVKLLANW